MVLCRSEVNEVLPVEFKGRHAVVDTLNGVWDHRADGCTQVFQDRAFVLVDACQVLVDGGSFGFHSTIILHT